MKSSADRAVAIVGVGAVLPDAPNTAAFWKNLSEGRYSISEVPRDRWNEDSYYDPDPRAVDKTYSKIGGWVRDFDWNPLQWRLPIPPKVAEVMDLAQKWGIVTAREALADYGYPERKLDGERTAVILGNALGGDYHLLTAARILFPEFAEELSGAASFQELPEAVQSTVMDEFRSGVQQRMSDITEDTMPGELANIVAGRLAALFDFKGPNYITDAACASAMAAISAAIEGLVHRDYDAVLTGGVDANMSPSTFVKFCKIGALSATGTRPYAEGADGFVMGEGAACFLLKRLEDAERDGDKVYAVIRGVGGSSDGKGKGITAPNPVGQLLAVRRGWENAGVSPEPGDLIEGHGTSTKVGDVAEAQSLAEAFAPFGLPAGSVALGSVKSNIGHLKAGAGAAGVLKAALSLYHKQIPPSVNFHKPNPAIDFAAMPFRVNTELRDWNKDRSNGDTVRRAGVSAFGFGGTNFHVVLEEYVPGRLAKERAMVAGAETATGASAAGSGSSPTSLKDPLRGALVIGGASEAEIANRLRRIKAEADAGVAPPSSPPFESDLRAPIRLALDYDSAGDLAELAGRALQALEEDDEGRWRALRNKGVYLGRGTPGKVAFLFTGQGSQYVNMLAELRDREPMVADIYREADRAMEPLIGAPLTERIFVDPDNEEEVSRAAEGLRQTAITQPAVLTVDTALARVMGAYGIRPDMVMGHSLGEYGALVAAGGLPFADALNAVAARGKAMTDLSMGDPGLMAAVFGPVEKVDELVREADGYVVIANLNSSKECVIGGATEAVQAAMKSLQEANLRVVQLPVSHAFHTRIVEPAAAPLIDVLKGLGVRAPDIPVISNVTGEFYPDDGDVVARMIELLGRQIGSPVQFVKGLNTLYDAGARVFVEMGPKRVLYGLAEDVLGDRDGFRAFYTNHPRTGDVVSLNRALCGLYAEGLGYGKPQPQAVVVAEAARVGTSQAPVVPRAAVLPQPVVPLPRPAETGTDRLVTLGRMFADFMERSFEVYSGGIQQREIRVGITGASLGLPGTKHVFEDENVARILRGELLIDSVPQQARLAMVDRRVTRLVKGEQGEANFEPIDDTANVIKLAGIGGELDLAGEYGYPADRVQALDRVSALAIAAGIDALRDAGIPLVQRYKTTTTGSKLPDGWLLPAEMRDDTAVIFASAFPGLESMAGAIESYHEDRSRRERLAELQDLRRRLEQKDGDTDLTDLDGRIAAIAAEIESNPYAFDRRFLFRVLAMGHSQFAEFIGARGPNIQTNSACASGTQAVALARDWIAIGRCRRAIIITADDVTTETLLPWMASGFLASGAAATDERVEDAALPFDRRRHGMIMGMGGTALVIEDVDAAAERGVQPICEVLGTITENSAFHGSRLDINHIAVVMEDLVAEAERRWGIDRHAIAPQTVFVSHETYTPVRGGSASAEIAALRHVFGGLADSVVIANTKGFTGHPMGVGIEDTLAVKMLESGIVPPVANFREVDPTLGELNLSKGGNYPIQYALRLAAGFGSQISMMLLRWTPPPDGARRAPQEMGFRGRVADDIAWQNWLARVTGYDAPEVEVVRRTFRVRDQGPPKREPATRPTMVGQRLQSIAPMSHAAPIVPVQHGAPTATVEPITPTAPVAPPPPVAPSSPAPPAASPRPAAAPSTAVQDRVLAIIAEQTGYPPDMLALDLDLEADLGIDTVKQAEMFAAIREVYGIERDETLALRDYPTLAHAIEFVFEKRPDLREADGTTGGRADGREPSAGAEPVTPSSPTVLTTSSTEVQQRVLAIIAEQTGYPPDMLALDLDLEADLGIDTVKQAEMFAAIREVYGIERDETLALRDYPTLAHAIEFVFEKRPDLRETDGTTGGQADGREPSAGAESVTPSSPTVLTASSSEVQQRVLAIIAEQTGYPPDMLDLDLDLEADLGIDTVKQAEMFAAIRDVYDIERDETLALKDYPTLAHAIEFVFEKRPDLRETDGTTGGRADGREPSAGAESVTPSSPTALTASSSEVQQRVLAIIAEQTGYPPDMLDLDLDLEADLGIDTVKQAEMFAAIREVYDIERDETLALRDYPTLAHAIEFVFEKRPDLRSAQQPEVPQRTGDEPVAPIVTAAPTMPVASEDAAQAIPRRVPVPLLRPDADMFSDTGVSLGEGDRVVVVLDRGGVGNALVQRLERLGVTVLPVEDPGDPETLAEEVAGWQASGGVGGVFWLPALDAVAEDELTDHGRRRSVIDSRVKSLYATMRALYDADPFLVSATRLGGRHGYDPDGATDVVGGAVVGFTKAYSREKPASLVKAIDFAPSRKTAAIADRLISEVLHDPGVVEVGYAADRRWTVGMEEQPIAFGDGLPGEEGVFVITGAAGSIVSAIVADLAAASKGTFWLLDLTPEPDPSDADVRRLGSDREGLKRDLFERMKQGGERVTPAMVEQEMTRLERSQAATAAIEAVRSAGGNPQYRSVDLRDAERVADVMGEIVAANSRIDVLLHAAGLEVSRPLPKKERGEYDLVFDVKVDGWYNLLAGLGDAPLGAAVVFSSIAGRFGNAGQTDYSAANDLLCKAMSAFRRNRPETLGIALDWTAWAGIGMATRGSIPTIMKQAGIDMLPPEAGIPIVRRELSAGTTGEVIVADGLGVMVKEERAVSARIVSASPSAAGPMAGTTTSFGAHRGLVVETRLDPSEQPFLHDHQIDGTPVLPGVMGIEAMSQAAVIGFPFLHVAALEDVEFLMPFKFYRGEPRTVAVEVRYESDGDDVLARCAVIGSRTLHGREEPEVTTHFTGTVRLTPEEPAADGLRDLPVQPDDFVAGETIYDVYFHGPAYRVLECAWRQDDVLTGRYAVDLPPNHEPVDAPTVVDPRLIELAFQTAGLAEIAEQSRMGLPSRIERLVFAGNPVREQAGAIAYVTGAGEGAFDAAVTDGSGRVLFSLSGYRTSPLPVAIDAEVFGSLRE